MKSNVSGQFIGAQMINAATGAAFTGTVTVYVTGDNGTQTLGSVGSGICAHKGNGYHSYVPSQAETNFGHNAFTFVGTGAIPATGQLYTNFPQTVDNKTGITAGTITTVTNLTTNNDKTGYGLSNAALTAIWDALTSGMATSGSIGKKLADWVVGTIDTYTGNTKQTGDTYALANGANGFAATKTVVDAIKVKTDNLPSDPADQSLIVAATDVLGVAIAALNNLSIADVQTGLTNQGYTSGRAPNLDALTIIDVRMLLALKILKNKLITDKVTGILTVYDDDDSTPLVSGPIWKNAAGTIPYDGTGVERRDRLT